ncbi:hypothetical protein OBBRIDRAFT_801254 [Obba rivulosa]|uniref:Uncharacterized protein n=1 Tax=Obba rivulosa TaxID=1052685 RepID=A0A8E2DRG5_9APHY|nr:hypothetical protein OBBRIDRAFT_801254 [Obba rivulosa]
MEDHEVKSALGDLKDVTTLADAASRAKPKGGYHLRTSIGCGRKQPYRNANLAVLDADHQGEYHTAGQAGPLAEAGVINIHSQQIPLLIPASLDHKTAGMSQSENALAKKIGHGREGLYFGENGKHALYDVGRAIGAAMVEPGRSEEEIQNILEGYDPFDFSTSSEYLGSNSRCRAERSRSIGWNPTKTIVDMVASVKPEIASIVNNPGSVKIRLG